MTIMYNVVDRLRSGEALTKAEREVHKLAACGTLRDLHDELDRLVAEAYGWTWPEPSTVILERLVTLHDRRVEEERAGTVPWRRPEYQIARFAKSTETEKDPKAPEADDGTVVVAPPSVRAPWPSDAIGQITALSVLTATLLECALRIAETTFGPKHPTTSIIRRNLERLQKTVKKS